jgi:hypothetical protein
MSLTAVNGHVRVLKDENAVQNSDPEGLEADTPDESSMENRPSVFMWDPCQSTSRLERRRRRAEIEARLVPHKHRPRRPSRTRLRLKVWGCRAISVPHAVARDGISRSMRCIAGYRRNHFGTGNSVRFPGGPWGTQ